MVMNKIYYAKEDDREKIYLFLKSVIPEFNISFEDWEVNYKEKMRNYRGQYVVFENRNDIVGVLSLSDFVGDPSNTRVVNFQAEPKFVNEDVFSSLISYAGDSFVSGYKKLGASYLENEVKLIEIFKRQGFQEVARYSRSYIDCYDWIVKDVQLPERFEIISFEKAKSQRENFKYELYEIYETILENIPENNAYKRCDFPSFLDKLKQLEINEEISSFITFESGLIGMSIVLNEGDDVFIELTGINYKHQKLGLASSLKRHVLNKSMNCGIKKVFTYNEVKNDPILKINKKLGFINEVANVILERTLLG